MSKDGLGRVIFEKMAILVDLLLLVIKFLAQRLFRINMDSKVKMEPVPEATETEEEEEEEEEEEGGFVGFNEEEEEYKSNFTFKFEYQIPELIIAMSKEKEPSVLAKEEGFPVKSTSISNSQLLSEKDLPELVAEPEAAMACSVHEPVVDPSRAEEDIESECSSPPKDVMLSDSTEEENTESILFSAKAFRCSFTGPTDFTLPNDDDEPDPFIGRRGPKFPSSKGFSKSFKELKDVLLSKESCIGREDAMFLEEEKPVNDVDTKSWGEKEVSQRFSGFGSDSDSTSSSDGYTVKNLVVDCDSDGFLSEKDFGEEEEESLVGSNRFGVELMEEEIGNFELGQSSNSNAEFPYGSSELELELELELKELNAGETEESTRPSSASSLIELTDSDDDELPSSPSDRPDRVEKKGLEEELLNSEDARGKDLEAEELDGLDSLWDDQDLSEQLRMEKARAFGLPTIFEESESPKAVEDLKPWKMDEKFLRVDAMDELHKFYKSYRERMRKLDILNYQKMYAMGFLQLKVPLQSMGSQKPLIPTILSHLSQNLRPLYRRKSSNIASDRSIKELQVDLETVYVGQTCLSWEFLRWQYEKAREIPESDPYRNRQYNQVAGEFQQFQVLARRFIENEPFQGPRLPNYVKNRCDIQNFLQVPHHKGLLEGENGGKEERQRCDL
ncbi:uncharacterized protein M6B38_397720 [Iris pallida]|uniref:Uncharacterized protein n=1 Tax=Iris pallida TaxID=29817 RepID=A0AAX6FW69_IRIPA|nr:uncharacterized protein M6B38_397720 [Iris pallida]